MENRVPILEVTGLSTGYRRVKIVKDLRLSVLPAEIVCIIGPNGAGKSTVLRAVYGFLPCWTGTLRFKGDDITHLPAVKRASKGMALVHQDGNIFPSLTIQENLEMGGYLIPEASERKARMDRLFAQLPFLHEKRKHAARSLSGGERQLLAIGMALMTDPDLLLLDEPSMGLSPQMMDRVFSWIVTIHDAGKSILMVEQNAKQALELAHRGYVLDLGTNRFEGDAKKLLDDPKVKRLYLGGGERNEDLS